MAKINLRGYYPDFYAADYIIEVPNELARQLRQWDREESAYERRRYRYKAHYSLDRDDGIEHDVLFVPLSPCELYECRVTYEQLYAAMSALPNKQRSRIFAHYFLGMSKTAIAHTEGVSKETVGESIQKGLKNIGRYLEKNLL